MNIVSHKVQADDAPMEQILFGKILRPRKVRR